MLRLRISGAIPPLTIYVFMEWTGTTLSLPHRNNFVSDASYKHMLDIKIHHLKETVTAKKLFLVKLEKVILKSMLRNEDLW
jgi:hypothetical protein